mmetsp:Transcript_2703/g.6249  ORF Transcript_2703/g.6249 Transcript_2703/m.6249 type:complete len:172 (-) Transcript_2703:29-544(-)
MQRRSKRCGAGLFHEHEAAKVQNRKRPRPPALRYLCQPGNKLELPGESSPQIRPSEWPRKRKVDVIRDVQTEFYAGEMKRTGIEKKLKTEREELEAFMRLPNGRRVSLPICRHDTSSMIRMKLYEKHNINSQNLHILYRGKVIGKYATCEDIDFVSGSTLHLHYFPLAKFE